MSEQRGVTAYLGPEKGRWGPASWAAVVEAASGGLLDETHWVELKEDLPPGNRGSNTELARDLASLAVDGGLYVIGVEDDDGRAGNVCGAELGELAERVGQVARDRVQPSLVVRCHEVPEPDRPGWGCLLVHVPPSPVAPHMVDNVYFARGDKAKFKLNDERVREIMSARASRRADIARELHQLRDDDLFPAEDRGAGHLYVVAQPEFGPDDALLGFLRGSGAIGTILQMLREVEGASKWRGVRSVVGLSGPSRRAEGLAVTNHHGEARPSSERQLLEIVVREDGGTRLTSGQGTVEVRHHSWQEASWIVHPKLVLHLTYAAAALAGRLGDQHAAYQGPWQLGVLLDRVKGVLPVEHIETYQGVGAPFSRDAYERTTSAPTEELVNAPEVVTERLVGQLLRALGVADRYFNRADVGRSSG